MKSLILPALLASLAASLVLAPASIVAAPAGATNVANLFDDIVKQAEAASQVKNFQGATQLYDKARTLPKISAEQKARAQFGFAASRHEDAKANNRPLNLIPAIQADYEAALKSPQLPSNLRIKAHEAVGDLLVLRRQRVPAAREYQKILALPAAKNESIQQYYVNRIFTELQKTEPSPEAMAVADAVYKQSLPLLKSPLAIVSMKQEYAKLLTQQDQGAKSQTVWNEVAQDTTLPIAARAGAYRNIGATERSQKNWPAALAAADALSALAETSPQSAAVLKTWRGWDRAAVFFAQGDETKGRAELEALAALPELPPAEKGRIWTAVAASYAREMQATPANTALTAPRKAALENVWKLQGAAPGVRAQAMLNLGQLELNAKNPAAAVVLLENGLKQVDTWNAQPAALAGVKRELNFALATIHRSEKEFGKALSALLQAQQFNPQNDKKVSQAAIALSQEAFNAQKWDNARASLLALEKTWGMSRKAYLLNLIHIDVAEEKWPEARAHLAEAAALNPTAQEMATLEALRKQIPAT